MRDEDRLTRLISSIYDTALDTTLWPDVLGAVADFSGGQATGLLAKDTMQRCVAAHCHARVDPHYLRLYRDTYSHMGPVATSLYCDVDQVVGIPELVPYEEYRRSRFYQEWAKPQGWADIAIAVLEKSAAGCTCLSVVRTESSGGMVDDEMRRRIGLLTPHLRRATLINRTIDFKRAEAETLSDVVDGLAVALVLIDGSGRIVHCNTAAEEILEAADFLRSAGGRLVAKDAEADQALRESVTVAAEGDGAVGVKGIAIPLAAHNGERYVAHVLPLTSGSRRSAGAAYTAAAAIFIRKATLECPSPPEIIGRTYRLTPAELRVLVGIVEIGGVPEVAADLGVADTTVKTHLRRLFEKTGTSRQADLVKLVAGFSTPLAH